MFQTDISQFVKCISVLKRLWTLKCAWKGHVLDRSGLNHSFRSNKASNFAESPQVDVCIVNHHRWLCSWLIRIQWHVHSLNTNIWYISLHTWHRCKRIILVVNQHDLLIIKIGISLPYQHMSRNALPWAINYFAINMITCRCWTVLILSE